jgi:hypothetical protein
MEEIFSTRSVPKCYSQDKVAVSEPSSVNIELTLHKAPISSVMTYACSGWELAADTYLLKLQRLQNKVLCIIENFPRRTPIRDLHTAFILPYVYDYKTKLCRQQAESHKITRMNMFATLTSEAFPSKLLSPSDNRQHFPKHVKDLFYYHKT